MTYLRMRLNKSNPPKEPPKESHSPIVLKEYEVWVEGYCITGATSDATFLGKYKGRTFTEACIAWVNGDHYGRHRSYNPDNNSYWGCKFFDNEADARKSFG